MQICYYSFKYRIYEDESLDLHFATKKESCTMHEIDIRMLQLSTNVRDEVFIKFPEKKRKKLNYVSVSSLSQFSIRNIV